MDSVARWAWHTHDSTWAAWYTADEWRC